MSQVQRKFIANDAINGSKIRLDNNEVLRARNAANTADVSILKVDATDALELQLLPVAAGALPIPTSDKQFATVEYIKNYVLGKVDAKDAVNLMADTNVALTGTTGLTIDSVAVTNGMRIALTGQTTGSQNGIYDASISGSNWALTRSADFDQAQDAGGLEVTQGAYFMVIQGTNYAGYEVILNTPNPITIGTTALTFARYPTATSLVGGDMVTKTGNTLSVDLASNGGLESTNAGNVSGQLRVKTRTGDLEKDRTVQLDATGNVVAKKSRKAMLTLSASHITNQYVDLPDVAAQDSVQVAVAGAGEQVETSDFTVNYTGGTSSKTRVSFAGGLATGGVSALAAGDVMVISYTAFV